MFESFLHTMQQEVFPLEKFVYFVSYVSEEGFDMCSFTRSFPIERYEDVLDMRDTIEEEDELENVSILNWIFLESYEE